MICGLRYIQLIVTKNLIKKYILYFKDIKNHVKNFNILRKIMNQ